MKIVHTMIRVNDLDESLKFYCDGLGMKLLKKRDYESGRFTNVFVGYGSEETDAVIELTYNWDTHAYDIGNGFGHIALGVPDVYKTCAEL
ncbi:MAG TPA: VOC family protein, partial [Candidatus Binatia bacterium]